MCGITGIFAFNSIGRINLVHLEAATRCLEKRGPDYQNTWFDEVVGLGHRRLSVIDTTPAGNQPMQDATGRYHIIFNGEIYNYRQLRQELQGKGITFSSESDTEVLLYAYIEWGPECLERLNGFFAFAVYDAADEILFLARDRFGIKPLLYFQDEDKLIFASEMKSILSYGIDRKLDLQALNLYFQLTYIPAPFSIIEGVKKLEPGHYLLCSRKSVDKKRYYDLPFREQPEIHDPETAKRLLIEKLRKSVRDRLVADVPLGAFLSGGIDSSVIVALASEQVPDLKTYSIGFASNKYFDETNYANLVAKRFQTDHHVFSLTNDDLLNEVKDVVSSIDEPFADSSALPVFILSRKTREHVTVALSGDGADELFSGYNKHSAWLMSLEPGFRNKMIRELGWFWKALPGSRSNFLTDTFRKLDRFASMEKFDLKERYWYLATFTRENQINRLLTGEYRTASVDSFKEHLLDPIRTGDLNEVLAVDSRLVLPGDMLTKVDLMSMAHGLEVRVPFLDPAVVDLAFNLSSGLKANASGRKIVLREAFKDLLPPEVYHRQKHGFEVPLLDWFRKEMRAELNEMVFNPKKIRDQGIFEWKEISWIKRKLFSFNPGDIHILVWSLYVFQNWYSRYFRGTLKG